MTFAIVNIEKWCLYWQTVTAPSMVFTKKSNRYTGECIRAVTFLIAVRGLSTLLKEAV